MNLIELGKALKLKMHERELKIKDLVELTGCTKNTLPKVFRGNQNVLLSTYIKVADALNVTIKYVVEENE